MAAKGDKKIPRKIKIDEDLLRHRKRRRLLEDAGEVEAVRRLDFGFHIFRMRTMAEMTQEEASRRAGISRKAWGQLEKGHISRSLIPKVAKALSINEARLYRRAGLEVPKTAGGYNLDQAQQDFELALLDSENLAIFFTHLQLIWTRYKQEKLGLNKRFAVDAAHARVFARALGLTRIQKVIIPLQ